MSHSYRWKDQSISLLLRSKTSLNMSIHLLLSTLLKIFTYMIAHGFVFPISMLIYAFFLCALNIYYSILILSITVDCYFLLSCCLVAHNSLHCADVLFTHPMCCIIMAHCMHQMRTTAVDDLGVCQSVTFAVQTRLNESVPCLVSGLANQHSVA